MEYQIRPQPDDAVAPHVLVHISGAPSEQAAFQMLRDLRAGSDGLECALVEVRVAFELSPVSVLNLVNGLRTLGFPAHYRIAVLLLDDVARASAKFAEDAAFNRGLAVRAFRERAEALAWLAQDT